MSDIKISDMMKMQMALYEKHKDTWSPMEAQYGRNFILWMMEEVGEVISIIKKNLLFSKWNGLFKDAGNG